MFIWRSTCICTRQQVWSCGQELKTTAPLPVSAAQARVQTGTMAPPISGKCDLKTDGRLFSTTSSVSQTLTQPFKKERPNRHRQPRPILHVSHHNTPYLFNMHVFRQHGVVQTQPQRRCDGSQQYVGPRNSYRLLQLHRITAVEAEKQPVSSAASKTIIMMLCLPTWRLRDRSRIKKTSIRLVIAARLADVLFGMALGFSAEFGRNTPTGASWYNRAAWAAIHPARLTPFPPLFFSLSTHPRGSLPLSILPPPLPVWTGTSWLH